MNTPTPLGFPGQPASPPAVPVVFPTIPLITPVAAPPATVPQPPAPNAKQGPQAQMLPTVVPRKTVTGNNSPPSLNSNRMTLAAANGQANTYEDNLLALVNKSLDAAQHDRELAISLLQIHLDRAEVLDAMALSMPVATVISDNTGAILKSLELTQRAGERVLDLAKLLVEAKKADDASIIKMFQAKLAEMKLIQKPGEGEGGWGDTSDLGGGAPGG